MSYFTRAIQMHESLTNRRMLGHTQAKLAVLLAKQGRFEEGLESVAQAVAMLRDVADPNALAIALCDRAEVAHRTGAPDAHKYRQEAQETADRNGQGQQSELGQILRHVAKLLSNPVVGG